MTISRVLPSVLPEARRSVIHCACYGLQRLEREALRRSLSRSEFELSFHAADPVDLAARMGDTPHDLLLLKVHDLINPGPAQRFFARVPLVTLVDPKRIHDNYKAIELPVLGNLPLPALDDNGELQVSANFLDQLRRFVRNVPLLHAKWTAAMSSSTAVWPMPLPANIPTPLGAAGAPVKAQAPSASSKPSAAPLSIGIADSTANHYVSNNNLTVSEFVLIGASTGGPNAIAKVVQRLPLLPEVAIVIVQHIEADFLVGFADWLKQQSAWPVVVADDGDFVVGGRIYVAPAKHHLELRTCNFRLRQGFAHEVHVPSVNRLFQSFAAQSSSRGVAVLLTGMGDDGALGMAELKAAGWRTIAQDQASSSVYGMPRAAAKLGVVDIALPIEQIGAEINRSIMGMRRKK